MKMREMEPGERGNKKEGKVKDKRKGMEISKHITITKNILNLGN